MLCGPFLHGWWGELRAADPSNVQEPVKQNASPGEQSEAPRRRWKPGQEQNPGPENQDSQHMLEQPRGYFPCFTKLHRASGKKKAHEHKLFGPVALGTPRECPRDKPGLSPGQSGFVPGTNPGFLLMLHSGSPVCPWDKPSLSLGHSRDEGRQTEFMC